MKKNPLSEIYESKVLTSEAVPSNKVKGEKELDAKIEANAKATTVKGQGPEACAKDLHKPEEHTEYSDGNRDAKSEPSVLKDSMEAEETKSYEGAFEKLFKATINEEEMMDDPSMEMDVTVPTSDEEMADEIEGTNDEVSDLVGDLKDLMSKLQSILDKVGEETSSEVADEVETELGGEDEVEAEEEPFEEAVKADVKGHALHNLKAGTELMHPSKKEIKGAVKVTKGTADGGKLKNEPEPKVAKSFDKTLQSVKSKPEVKSTVKKGDFFK
jgi:hypothetical protein